jgi:hypothetical protein
MKKLLLLLLLLPLHAYADWGVFHFKSNDKVWVEGATELPPYPKTENLIPFPVSSVTRNRYFIDAASINVSQDEVVRYAVVIETAGGAKNVSFEGMRCDTAERRIYAYGHPDGTWSKAGSEMWDPINFSSGFSYQKALYEDHFCVDHMRIKNSAEAIANLRRSAQ